MEFKDYLYYAGAGFLAVIYRVSKETGKSARYFLSLVFLALFMSVVIAPAISEYYNLTVRMTSALSGFLVLFGTTILDVIEKRLPSKLNEKIDSL
jgi:uncharacterized membrane protein